MSIPKKRIIVISSPSGGGKTIVSKYILENYRNIKFSVSATTRQKRQGEKDGVHYYFLDKVDFETKIKNGELVEFEKLFDNYYGTLYSEIDDAFKTNRCILFDIDVKGACTIKEKYPNDTILIFLMPPSMEILQARLINRDTENQEQIKKRLKRAKMEISIGKKFDYIIINDVIEDTLLQISKILDEYL